MLVIEKAVKLLDDFHLEKFRQYLKEVSIRSYYPLALVDVIDRDFRVEQESRELYRLVYGDPAEGEKDMKKLFQLAYHTFLQTAFLANNYPNYLEPNIVRIQEFINTGRLEEATTLADILLDMSEKVEDFSTLTKVLRIQAQTAAYQGGLAETARHYRRIGEVLEIKRQLNQIHQVIFGRLAVKGKTVPDATHQEQMALMEKLADSENFSVKTLALLNIAYLRYLHRDPLFFTEANFALLAGVEEEVQKNEHVLMPYMYNLLPKIHFLKLHYLIRKSEMPDILAEARKITEDGKMALFWNSFLNLPEINSITIQSSHLISQYYGSYRPDFPEILPDDIRKQVDYLIQRCAAILENPVLEEKFVQRYVLMSAVYAGLLLLGDADQVRKSVQTIEGLLLFYQQVSFKMKLDAIYTTLIMGNFALQDFEQVEKTFRRYKKTGKDKVVNEENDLTIQGIYYAAKFIENGRAQYAKKMQNIIAEADQKEGLQGVAKQLREIADFFAISAAK